MKHVNALIFAVLGGLTALALAAPVHAAPGAAATPAPMSEGEILKVDKTTGKLTIKHGELKNLGMQGMTMMFKVRSPDMLDKVKQGDKVRFIAEQTGAGLVVASIEVVK